jgi:FkbM family methyltransferase
MNLINLYAQIIHSTFRSIVSVKGIYKKQKVLRSSAYKEDKAIGFFSKIMEKTFEIMTSPLVLKSAKYDFTMEVDYECHKLLIRPFILSEIVMACGLWEIEVKNLLYSEVKNTDVIVDVGAYIGIYAISLAKKANKIIAFEPHPETFKILEKNIKINDLANVSLIKKAAGEAKMTLEYSLSYDPKLSGVSEVQKTSTSPINIEVQAIDLDTALSDEPKIDWLLIDAEGYELNVLAGARKIIKIHSPKIIMEINTNNLDQAKEIMARENYSFQQLNPIMYYAIRQG